MGRLKAILSQPWIVAVVAGSLIAVIALAGMLGLANNLYVKGITDGDLRHAVDLQTRSSDVRDAVSELRSHHRDLLLYGSTLEQTQDLDAAYKNLQEQIDLLDQVGVDEPDAPKPDGLREQASVYYEGFHPAIEQQGLGNDTFERASDRGLAQLAKLKRDAERLEDVSQSGAQKALDDVARAESIVRVVLILVAVGLILALLALAYTGLQMVRLISELRGLHAEQRAAAEAKTDFLADISHELRTPLTVLRSNAEFGLAIDQDWPHRVVLEEIVKESVHMTRMTEDLLLLARTDSASLPIEKRSVSIPLFVADLAGRAEVLARERGARLRTELAGDGRIEIDPSRVEQAVLALVDNAAKYGPKGGVVTFSTRTGSGQMRLEVADEGPGIAEEDLGRIFERFHRAGGTRSRRGGGSGLGLPIARSIVELHGGRIEAVSDEDGTRMTVCLPLPSATGPAGGVSQVPEGAA